LEAVAVSVRCEGGVVEDGGESFTGEGGGDSCGFEGFCSVAAWCFGFGV